MTKLLAVIALCTLCIAVSLAKSAKAIHKYRESDDPITQCRIETGAMPNDVEDLLSNRPARRKEVKCMRACLMKTTKLMNSQGQFVKSEAMRELEEYLVEKVNKNRKVISDCAAIAVPQDHCEAAELYNQFLHTYLML